MNEAEQARCEKCGAALAPSALGELCPRCLMALNLGTRTEDPARSQGPAGTIVVDPMAEASPPISEIAAHFPQLDILECLGRGGMGVVYKARQKNLDRLVALKILAPEKKRDACFAERFAREAQALAKLNHPNIVTVHDSGEAGGLFYLLMEYVDGVSLRQLLQTKKITPEEAVAIVPRICEALQYAHEHGIVHRDIKPENILLDRRGGVKIADFGIAKLIGPEQDTRTLTQEKQVIGTPHYMAPEQIEQPQRVDHRADIYSLGVVFYELLTGELPLGHFQPPSGKVLVDVRLDAVVLRALEKEPERRYQQASQVKGDVETISASPGAAEAAPRVLPRGGAPATAPSGQAVPQAAPDRWQRLKYRIWPPLVGRRNGQRVVNWPAVAMRGTRAILVVLIQSAVLAVVSSRVGPGGMKIALIAVPVFAGMLLLVCAVMVIRLLRGLAVPLDHLPELDAASGNRAGKALGLGILILAGLLGLLAIPGTLAGGYLLARHQARARALDDVLRVQAEQQKKRTEVEQARIAAMLKSGIAQRLKEAGVRYEELNIGLSRDLEQATIILVEPSELRGVNGRNEWVPVEGSLVARRLENEDWEITGDGQLGHVRFTVTNPRRGAAGPR